MANQTTTACDNEIILSWKTHSKQLVSSMQRLFEEEAHFDCTLWADGCALECHRLVLSACSPFLRDLITNHPEDTPNITLAGMSKAELNALVEFIYTGETTISTDQVEHFLEASKFLQLTGLQEYTILNEVYEVKEDMKECAIEVYDGVEVETEENYVDLKMDTEYILDDETYISEDNNFLLEQQLDNDTGLVIALNDVTPIINEFHEERIDDENAISPGKERSILRNSYTSTKSDCDINSSRYKCPKCGNSYSHKRTLLHHMHWICDQPATYSCSFCPYMGKRKFQLKSHMKHVHFTSRGKKNMIK